MTTPPESYVFVSYSLPDRSDVDRLIRALIDRRISVRWDQNVPAGHDVADWLAGAAAVLVVWSGASANSSKVVNEATKAQLNGTLVPATIEGYGVIPVPFRSLQTIDLTGWHGSKQDPNFERLVKALSAPMLPNQPLTSLRVRPAAREILRLALAIAHSRGVVDAGTLDVLLARLLQNEYTELDQAELASGATAAVVRTLPQPANERIAAVLRAAGVNRSKVSVSGRRSIDDPRLAGVVAAADGLARQVGATQLCSHHVVATALVQPLPASVLSALGVNDNQLRTALRIGIDQRWPKESRSTWDKLLSLGSRPGISSIYRDRVCRVIARDSQRITGLAFLIDTNTAMTLAHIVPSDTFVQLEALGTRRRSSLADRTVGRTGRISLLKLAIPFGLRSADGQLEPTIPKPRTPLETVGFDAAGNPFLLSCVVDGMLGEDLALYIHGALAPDVILVGAPVIAQERVVGLVKAYAADQILVVPSTELLRAIEDPVPEELVTESGQVETSAEDQGLSRILTPAALNLVTAAVYVHGDRPSPVDSVELLLGGLWKASMGEAAAELAALWAALPDTSENRWVRVAAALTEIGSPAAVLPAPSTLTAAAEATNAFLSNLETSALTSLVGRARALALRLGGSDPIEIRHLLAVVLGRTAAIPAAVEAALGVTSGTLRQALRDAVRQTADGSGELETVWDELLGTDEPTLVSSFDSDLVAWDDTRPLTDHLDIENYVNMLSLVVASTDTPMPLSIGLFGPWGSGKTYFMGLMRQAIKRLAEQAEQERAAGRMPVSCARIVPITFNAWHYADANLWASLAVRIFDELAGREKKKRTELEEQRQRLLEKLTIYRELKGELAEEHERAHSRKKQLEGRLAEARERKDQAEERLNRLKLSDALAAAKDDPRLRQLWDRTSDELKELGIPADLERLSEAVAELNAEVKDAVTLRAALSDRGRIRALTLIVPVLLVIGVVLLVAPGVLRALGGTSIVAALAVAGRVTTWLQQREADIRLTLNHVEATISVADEARSRAAARNRVEVERAERDVQEAKVEIADLEDRQATAAAAAHEVDRQLAELKAGARLQRFIAERSASSDYQRQLGVVSLARRDFEDLTTALRDAIDDFRTKKGDPPVVDRIVLYIDDLDRCSAERVVQVLEAVHLLLAMDLFVVVVGVDPRWLLRSLRQRFRGVLSGTSEQDREGEFWQWTPQNYLEKIFQIPFVLPSMSPTGYQALLQSLSIPGRHEREPSRAFTLPDEPIPVPPQPESNPVADPAALPFEQGSPAVVMASESRLAVAAPLASLSPQLLDLTAAEIDLLGQLAPLVQTPRVAKRMLNIYRMLRVTRDLGPASRFLAGDYQAVCQLLALLTGYPRVFARVVWGEPADADYRGLLDRPESDRWSEFVDGLSPRPRRKGGWTNAVAKSIPPAESEDWHAIVTALVTVRRSLTLTDTLEPYQRWAPRIARFSFELSPFAGGGGRART